jgi:pimeloyl-ACP methyl ester carboxylesterase
MLAAIDTVRSRLDRLTMPLLLMHGSADRLTGAERHPGHRRRGGLDGPSR